MTLNGNVIHKYELQVISLSSLGIAKFECLKVHLAHRPANPTTVNLQLVVNVLVASMQIPKRLRNENVIGTQGHLNYDRNFLLFQQSFQKICQGQG